MGRRKNVQRNRKKNHSASTGATLQLTKSVEILTQLTAETCSRFTLSDCCQWL